jgi:hypothetical protein
LSLASGMSYRLLVLPNDVHKLMSVAAAAIRFRRWCSGRGVAGTEAGGFTQFGDGKEGQADSEEAG